MDDALRDQLKTNPEPLMVAMTTEHFTLGMARSQTITEANGRASIFLAAVTSGLIALGFLGPSGTTFEVFALVLFPALVFLGLVTFHRVLQNSIEDVGYAYRIDLCRRFYADAWPMLAPYLYRPRLDEDVQGPRPRWISRQLLLTVSGTVAVVTGLCLASFGALVAGVLAGSSIGVAFAVGAVVAIVSIGALHRQQRRAFGRADFSRIDAQMHREAGE